MDEHPKAWRYASIVHIDGFELGEGWVRLAMWLTSASPGGFHDWKTLYPSGAKINFAALLRLRLNHDLHAIDADGARLTLICAQVPGPPPLLHVASHVYC